LGNPSGRSRDCDNGDSEHPEGLKQAQCAPGTGAFGGLKFSEIFRTFVQQNNKGDTNLLMDRNSWKSSSSARMFFHPIESVN